MGFLGKLRSSGKKSYGALGSVIAAMGNSTQMVLPSGIPYTLGYGVICICCISLDL